MLLLIPTLVRSYVACNFGLGYLFGSICLRVSLFENTSYSRVKSGRGLVLLQGAHLVSAQIKVTFKLVGDFIGTEHYINTSIALVEDREVHSIVEILLVS